MPRMCGEVQRLKCEVKLLRRLAHPNIIHSIGHGTDEGHGFLFREY
jgi:serine/threonine protein kinase